MTANWFSVDLSLLAVAAATKNCNCNQRTDSKICTLRRVTDVSDALCPRPHGRGGIVSCKIHLIIIICNDNRQTDANSQ